MEKTLVKRTISKDDTRQNGKSRGEQSPIADNYYLLQDFFNDELKDIYWAEKHLVKTLPKIQKAATSTELKNAINDHLEQTKVHVTRLEDIFEKIGQKASAKKCEAMAGITDEGETIIDDTDEGTATRDVGLILAAQKVEHYEIATYGGLVQLAKTLGRDDVAEILRTTLKEEKQADADLTRIAELGINYASSGEREKR
jgi:ferritin-like metal-binding protein YciE